MPLSTHYLTPNWPAPPNIKAFTSLRTDGCSAAPFDSFNFSLDVGDNEQAVLANRAQLHQELNLPQAPAWLKQIHSIIALPAEAVGEPRPEADATYTQQVNLPCAVLTADCLPLLVCDKAGSEVAAIHAGWRGLAAGVIENTITQLQTSAENLLVWLGPAIGPQAFEVGGEVREAFLQHDPQAETAFQSISAQKWLADAYLLAKQRLARLGVTHIYGGEYCTYSDPKRFFSYRRDAGKTGRMISIIWKES